MTGEPARFERPALAVRLLAHNEFNSFGESVSWAAQTVTTVGYGDVVPSGTVEQDRRCARYVFRHRETVSLTIVRTAEQLRAMNERLERIEAALSL